MIQKPAQLSIIHYFPGEFLEKKLEFQCLVLRVTYNQAM